MVASNISGNIGKSERNHAEKPCLVQSLSIFSMAGFREWCSWKIFKTYLKESSWPCLAIWQMAAVFIIQPPTEWPGSWISTCANQRLVYTTTKLLLWCPVPTIHPAQGWHEHKKMFKQISSSNSLVYENIYTIDSSTWSLYWLKKSCKNIKIFFILCKENHWMKTIIFENKHQTDKIVMEQDCHGILASW